MADHDIEIRMKNAQKFLNNGNKVKIEMNLRGREHRHTDRAFQKYEDFAKKLGDIATIEERPRKMGRKIFMILKPNK